MLWRHGRKSAQNFLVLVLFKKGTIWILCFDLFNRLHTRQSKTITKSSLFLCRYWRVRLLCGQQLWTGMWQRRGFLLVLVPFRIWTQCGQHHVQWWVRKQKLKSYSFERAMFGVSEALGVIKISPTSCPSTHIYFSLLFLSISCFWQRMHWSGKWRLFPKMCKRIWTGAMLL